MKNKVLAVPATMENYEKLNECGFECGLSADEIFECSDFEESDIFVINDESFYWDGSDGYEIEWLGASETEDEEDTTILEELNFEEPDFEYEIYDIIDDYIVGKYFNKNKNKWVLSRWNFNGTNKQGADEYSFKLIEDEWYISDSLTLPCLVKNLDNGYIHLIQDIRMYNDELIGVLYEDEDDEPKAYVKLDEVEPLTPEEIDKLK